MSGVYVQIIEDATGTCVEQMGPHTERQAERIQRVAMINLNHDEFTVLISPHKKEVVRDSPHAPA